MIIEQIILNLTIAIFLIAILYLFIKLIIKPIDLISWTLKGGKIKMREYKCVEIEYRAEDTQDKLNRLAKDNWRVLCSYAEGRFIILERDSSWY